MTRPSRAYVLSARARTANWMCRCCITEILGGLLGISEEAVRDEKYIHYVRGIDAAAAEVARRARRSRFCWSRRRSTTWLGSRSRAA